MRLLFAFLLLAALAVLAALLFKLNAGYALFVAPPYRVELSLNAFILLVVAGFVLTYLLLRVGARIASLPREVRASRRRRNLERARGKQDAAVVALLEGRYGKARQFAEEALAVPQSSGLSALIAARAAIDMHAFDAAEAMLTRPDACAASLTVPRLMLEADLALEQGQPSAALAKLAELRREAGLHTAALRIEVRALMAAGRHVEVPPLVDQLVKRKVYDQAQGDLLRATAHAEALTGYRLDAAGLRDYWNRLGDGDRLHPKVARAAAGSFLALGGTAKPRKSSCAASSGRGIRTWSCSTPSATPPIRRASSRRRSAGSQATTRTRCCSTRLADCASANRCGARRRRISRRASRSTTTGGRTWRWANCTRGSVAPTLPTRISRPRSNARSPSLGARDAPRTYRGRADPLFVVPARSAYTTMRSSR